MSFGPYQFADNLRHKDGMAFEKAAVPMRGLETPVADLPALLNVTTKLTDLTLDAHWARAAAIALPISLVEAVPPRSRVSALRSRMTVSMARSITFAALTATMGRDFRQVSHPSRSVILHGG